MAGGDLKRKVPEEQVKQPGISHRIVTGDDLGLLKVTEVPAGNNWDEASAKHRWNLPDKSRAVSHLQACATNWSQGEAVVATAHAGGRIELCSGTDGQTLASVRLGSAASRGSAAQQAAVDVQGMRLWEQEPGNLSLLTATASGSVLLHRCSRTSQGSTGAVQTWECAQAASLQTISGNLLAMDVSSSRRHVAVGGDGHQLSVWDMESGEMTFKGKAGKPSRSGLQDLAHVTALTYVPQTADQQVLVGTSKHKLWLYDMRAGKKPQHELQWSEGRITAFAPEPSGLRIWTGNGLGQIEALDLESFKMGHAVKGSAGSVRALALHPTEPLIASVGLDRHLRVHDTDKHRQLLAKVYLKQQLSGVAWLPVPPPAPAQGEDEEGPREREADGQHGGEQGNGCTARTGEARDGDGRQPHEGRSKKHGHKDKDGLKKHNKSKKARQ